MVAFGVADARVLTLAGAIDLALEARERVEAQEGIGGEAVQNAPTCRVTMVWCG